MCTLLLYKALQGLQTCNLIPFAFPRERGAIPGSQRQALLSETESGVITINEDNSQQDQKALLFPQAREQTQDEEYFWPYKSINSVNSTPKDLSIYFGDN